MKLLIKLLGVFFCISLSIQVFSQNKEASMLMQQAILKMDKERDYKGARVLLKRAIKIEPENFVYQYEMAFSYYFTEDFKKAIKILKKIVYSSQSTPLYYQLMGNCYNRIKKDKESNEIYKKGIERFPNAGILYAGQGINNYNNKKYEVALEWFEKGIQYDPQYASNYYYANMLYSQTTELIWAVLYGEIYSNISVNTQQTNAMSKSLYDTYNKAITIKDTVMSVNFAKTAVISLSDLQKEFKLPFANGVFEINLLMGIIGEKEVSIAMLNRIRHKFINLYYEKQQNKQYPNVLFKFHKKLIKNNYFECYNYWLFYHGNKAEADIWIANNSEKYKEFLLWISTNKLELNTEKKFYRLQYN